MEGGNKEESSTTAQKRGDESFLDELDKTLPSLVSVEKLPEAIRHLRFYLLPPAQISSLGALCLCCQKVLKCYLYAQIL